MTVKEVFNLRKEGKLQEAWNNIQPMYAAHQGHYTTLAYFWTANDLLKQCLEEQHHDSARRLLFLMTKAYPNLQDDGGKANCVIVLGALRLDRAIAQFNLLYFMPFFQRLNEEDWKAKKVNDHWVPALGQRVVLRLFRHFDQLKDAQEVSLVMDFFSVALHHNPNDLNNLRIWARLQLNIGHKDEAIRIYRQLLKRRADAHTSYALSKLVSDPAERIALLCQAINDQRQEKFRSKMRVELAGLLIDKRESIALYELQKSRLTRQSAGHHVPDYALRMERQLQGVKPASASEERDFFVRAISFLKQQKR